MKTGFRNYAVWLLPEPECALALEALISVYAAQKGTPRFLPHATLCSGAWSGELSELGRRVEAIASELVGVKADVVGVDGKERYFHYCYLLLDPEALTQPPAIALQWLPEAHPPSVGLHVSLIYSDDFRGVDRKALTSGIQEKVPDRITFQALALVLPRANDWHDVANWHVERVVPLLDMVNYPHFI